MSKSANNLKSVLTDTAQAIKSKKGTDLPISPRDFADEIESIQSGAEKGTFDFRGSNFSTLANVGLFYNNASLENVYLYLPKTLSEWTNNIFSGAKGAYNVLFNSVPTLANANLMPTDSSDFTLKILFSALSDSSLFNASWSSLLPRIALYITDIESGKALQPYGAQTGAEITWYDSFEMTHEVSVSAGENNIYYGTIHNNVREVWYLDLMLTNADVHIVDNDTGAIYGVDNPFVSIGGHSITIEPVMTDTSKDKLVAFLVDGVSYKTQGSATITVNDTVVIQVTYNNIAFDPILANNTWEDIRLACELGVAANYWSVGDEKTDVGDDGRTRTFRIVDMQGLYNKHVVFESVYLETQASSDSGFIWSSSNISDDDEMQNNWSISVMKNTTLIDFPSRYSSDLRNNLTNTIIKTAKNCLGQSLIETSEKLFLEAEKEIFAVRYYSPTIEFNALSTYAYWQTHTTSDEHKKVEPIYYPSVYRNWWLRSPTSARDGFSACCVNNNGAATTQQLYLTWYIAPCFSF